MQQALPKAILIDMDDTILAFDSVSDASWLSVLEIHAAKLPGVSTEEAFRAIKASGREYWRDPERHRVGRLNMTSARQTIVRQALQSYGHVDDELVRQIAMEYDQTRTAAMHPIPGAIETVREMRGLGIKLALVTNGEASFQRQKIERFDLARLFDAILIEGECGYGKPDPRIYLQALSTLNTEPEDAWMIGDNWEWEVAAPQRLGIRAIWVNARERQMPADATVRPFRTVKSLVEVRFHE